MVVKVKASDPDYEAIALSMHLLGVLLNPGCWFGVNDLDPLWDDVAQSEIEAELRDIVDDVTFKELTHGLD